MSIGSGCPNVNGTTPPCLPSGSNRSSFRVLNPRQGLTTEAGEPYPFEVPKNFQPLRQHCTEVFFNDTACIKVSSILYPNEGVAALPHVDSRVTAAVARALLDINSSTTYIDDKNVTRKLVGKAYYDFQQVKIQHRFARGSAMVWLASDLARFHECRICHRA